MKYFSAGSITSATGRKAAKSMLLLSGFIIFCGIGLFCLSYWHSTRCTEAHTVEDIDLMIDSVTRRLLTAETETIQSSIYLESLLHNMQTSLVRVENEELTKLKSDIEYDRIQLSLSTQPSPLKHKYNLEQKYLDVEVLANKIGEILTAVEKEKKEKNIDGDDDDGSKSSKLFRNEKNERDDDFFLSNNLIAKQIVGANNKKELSDPESNFASNLDDNNETKLDKIRCEGFKKKYEVILGHSWGNLPYDLQDKWRTMNCDLHLS